MKKIIVMPDSFKGTMTSPQVSGIIKEQLLKYFPQEMITTIPIADGGEGTVDCFMHFTDARRVTVCVKGPGMEEVDADYAVFGETAIIEVASAAGFSLSEGATNPLNSTTFGVGQLLDDAVSRGCRKIILGLGGSCTNDAGAGMAAAMGVVFTDVDGANFIPTGKNLGRVAYIDITALSKRLDDVQIVGMCDITNPLYGPQGAAMMFAPQKGADKEEVLLLDEQLKQFSRTIERCLGVNVSEIKGAGAAGGMGAGIRAFLQGKLISGIDLLLDMVDLDGLMEECCCIITGEGRFDAQSLGGKVVSGICERARKKGVPVIVVTGEQEQGLHNLETLGIKAVFESGKIDRTQTVEQIQQTCISNLEKTSAEMSQYIYKNFF